jgi:ribosome-associated toxin RatA of RatAB toxin-antitoxin module
MALSSEQAFTTEVAASVAQCFAIITDFDKYPQWFSAIEHTQVLSRWPDGLAKRVEYRIDMKLKSIRYVLEYTYDKPTRLDWKSVDGDVEAIAGSYLFEKLGPKRSRVTCRQAVSLGFWVPGPLRKIMERHALQQSVLEFKDAAEHAAKKPARSRRKKT